MKQYLVLIFLSICSYTTYSQNYFQEGDKCFEEGDYACAETKYLELYKSASEENMDFGEIKIKRAKLCKENLKNANLAFNGKNYTKAKELYLAVLDSNPNDATAKSQLEIINTFLSKPKTTTMLYNKVLLKKQKQI
jgi:hypothetical protein